MNVGNEGMAIDVFESVKELTVAGEFLMYIGSVTLTALQRT